MNLRKLTFWNTPVSSDYPAEVSPPPAEAATPAQDEVSNVIKLAPRNPLDLPAGLVDTQSTSPVPPSAGAPQPRGLMDAPEVKAFFADNHFGLGYHNGANYKTQEARETGKQALVARFQNALSELSEQKHAKANRLRNMVVQTHGACDTTTAQLQLVCTHLERDIAVLHAQMESAQQHKGWILEALNRYHIGFDKGLRVAIDYELLGD